LAPPFVAAATYSVEGVRVAIRTPITRREPQLPYGLVTRELAVLPAIAVNVSPRQAIVPLSMRDKSVLVRVDLVNNATAGSTGQLALKLPRAGRRCRPRLPFSFTRPGEKATYRFIVRPGVIDGRDYRIEAVATANGKEFTTATRSSNIAISKPAISSTTRSFACAAWTSGSHRGCKVGYVMGVGDEVPAGIMQLGVQVRPLKRRISRRRSVPVRRNHDRHTRLRGARRFADLQPPLLDYVQNGGNLIVLYNTPAEFDPNTFAPYPGSCSRRGRSLGRGFAGDDSGAGAPGIHDAERDHRKPTSTGGWSSAARSSSASGIAPTHR
jgi:hypothetical protein